MESLQYLMAGFATALQPTNLIFAFMGCLVGTFVGVVPGLGPAAAMAMLIPITFVLDTMPAIIMLAAIYYGVMYGGTITSVLVNVPGEAASAVTCLDGHPMAIGGRAGPALAMAAIGSFVGATISLLALVMVALPVAAMGLELGPPEIFALLVVSLSLITGLAGRSLARSTLSAAMGMLIASIGIEPVHGARRFVFAPDMFDGFGIVPVVMGIFGIAEILATAEKSAPRVLEAEMRSLAPTWKDFRVSSLSILRGTVIGFFLGVIPGMPATVPTFMSYTIEKRVSKVPEKFGTGMIEGVAGPETANNACAVGHLIPLLTLGIPTTATMALLMSAFMMNGLIPGPGLFREHGDFVWAVVASLYIGNVMLLILNVPLIPMWVAILRIPYSLLASLILAFIVLGAYSLKNSLFDVGAVIGFGVMGYVFRKLDIPVLPLIMTLILMPLMEQRLVQSLQMSQGDFTIFVTRPISATLLAIAVLVVASSTLVIFRHPGRSRCRRPSRSSAPRPR